MSPFFYRLFSDSDSIRYAEAIRRDWRAASAREEQLVVMYRIPGYGQMQLDLEGAEGGSLIWVRLQLPPDPGASYGPPGYPSQDLGHVEPAPWTPETRPWDTTRYRAHLSSGEVLPFRVNREHNQADLMRAAGIDPLR